MKRRPTAIIDREDDGFVALCPELDVASQGAGGYFFFVTESFGPAQPLIWRLKPSGSLTWKLE